MCAALLFHVILVRFLYVLSIISFSLEDADRLSPVGQVFKRKSARLKRILGDSSSGDRHKGSSYAASGSRRISRRTTGC